MVPRDLDLFGEPIIHAHKTEARDILLALPHRRTITCEQSYAICRDIQRRPENWQENVRDELYRLRNTGYFTDGKRPDGTATYTRTIKGHARRMMPCGKCGRVATEGDFGFHCGACGSSTFVAD